LTVFKVRQNAYLKSHQHKLYNIIVPLLLLKKEITKKVGKPLNASISIGEKPFQ
jgi:hypothetical protein